jgi:hypothetical protein
MAEMFHAPLLQVPPTRQTAPPPRPGLVMEVPAMEDLWFGPWHGQEGEAQHRCGGKAQSADSEPADDAGTRDLLEGIRLLLAEEGLYELWRGCLTGHDLVGSVVDCWAESLSLAAAGAR